MATGLVENWVEVDQLGAIYPFVGTEGWLAFIGIACWLIWHFIQIRKESKEFQNDMQKIKEKGGVDKVLAEEASREYADMAGH